MKLLLENWKRYLKEELKPDDYEDEPFPEEQSEEDKAEAYLGNPKSIGEFLYKAYRNELSKQPDASEAQYKADEIAGTIAYKVKNTFPDNVRYLGHGVFRTAFSLNKNFIIKINSSFDEAAAQEMNKDDFTLSRDPQISKIFPKVYSHDPSFNWIVMDRVFPIIMPKELLSFFPNKNIPASLIDTKTLFYRSVLQNSIKYKVAETTRNKTMMGEVDYIYDTGIKDNLEREIGTALTMKEIVSGFDTTFFQVCNAILKYGIRITEIRQNNTGYTIDENGNKQFVILDSSIDASIKKGFGEPIVKQSAQPSTNQNANDATKPVKK
jgi:hypothetical protein